MRLFASYIPLKGEKRKMFKLNIKRRSLVAGIILVFLLQSLLVLSPAQATVHSDIAVNTAYNMITSGLYPNLLILDVRNQSELDAGYISGAVLLPVWQLQQRIAELSPYKNRDIVVFCKSGGRALNASLILDANNFTNVYRVLGGMDAYQNANYPIRTVVPPTSSWIGQTAMAHWDIIDTAHGNVTVGMDVFYDQQATDGSGRTDMIYIKVTHDPQGVSEATGYAVNITSGPIWSMNHVYLNATLAFNWTTGGLMNHPIAIDWLTSAPSTLNTFTSANGIKTGNGLWRSGTGNLANATITIGGSGPHPGNFTSNWAAVGYATSAPVAPVSASAFCNASIMAGQTWYFFAHSTGGVGQCTYQWYEGTTLLAGQTSMIFPATKATAGTYTYYCKINDSLGSTTNSNTITLTVT